jgi:hypothetical protein
MRAVSGPACRYSLYEHAPATPDVGLGSFASLRPSGERVRFTPMTGHVLGASTAIVLLAAAPASAGGPTISYVPVTDRLKVFRTSVSFASIRDQRAGFAT